MSVITIKNSMKHALDEEVHDAASDTPKARGGTFSRGFLIAVPVALALWAVIAWLI